MYSRQEKANGRLKRGAELPQSDDTTAETLDAPGVSKQQSSTWQKLAEASDRRLARSYALEVKRILRVAGCTRVRQGRGDHGARSTAGVVVRAGRALTALCRLA